MATANTRADIRNSVRAKISCWPDVVGTFGGNVLNTDTTMALAAAYLPYVSDRALIESLDGTLEIMQAIGVANPVTSPITIMRGVQGRGSAQAHTSGAALQIFPFWGWTDQALNDYIRKAIDWLGQSMVWTLKPYSNTWLSGYKEFGLPSGAVYPTGDIVKKVEVQDPSTSLYKQILGWTHQGDRIIMNAKLTQDLVVRVWIQSKQAQLTDDVTLIDTLYAQEALEMYSAARVLEELLSNRSRYYDYSASLNDRASTLDELQRSCYYFFNQATILADKVSRPGLSGYAAIQRP